MLIFLLTCLLTSWWNRYISKPYAKGDVKALERLQLILMPLLIRRTKVCQHICLIVC